MKDVVEALRIGNVDGDLLRAELIRKCLELRGSRNENNLRLERDNALNTGCHCVANLRDTLRRLGIITICRVANQTITGAHGINDFSQVWGQRNDPIDFLRKNDTASRFVGDCAGCVLRSGILICAIRTCE